MAWCQAFAKSFAGMYSVAECICMINFNTDVHVSILVKYKGCL